MTPVLTDPAGAPAVREFDRILGGRHPIFRDAVERTAARFGARWLAEFDATLTGLFPSPEGLAGAADGYARFAVDLIRRQRRFERDGVYPPKRYADSVREVYLDERYMSDQYLPGLLVAHYLWPHHTHHLRFFEAGFATQMPAGAAFVEVGVGTGLYSRRLLQTVPDACGVGVDVSPASARFAARHVSAFGLGDRYRTELRDVEADPIDGADWLVCIEVLEHLEDPGRFLRALRAGLAPDGRAFITAALNAAHVDHIYLYRSPDEVLEQLLAAGFELEQSFLAPAHAPAVPGAPVPAVAAFVLSGAGR